MRVSGSLDPLKLSQAGGSSLVLQAPCQVKIAIIFNGMNGFPEICRAAICAPLTRHPANFSRHGGA
jgi:hypothetical protein